MNFDDPSLTTGHQATANSYEAQPETMVPVLPQPPEPAETRFLKWMVFGSNGLRADVSLVLVLGMAAMML